MSRLICTAHRGAVLHFLDKQPSEDANPAYHFFPDGLLIEQGGLVAFVGHFEDGLAWIKERDLTHTVKVIEHGEALILPGLIDTHVHYPQLEMIGAYGHQLLDWLQQHTFPTEKKFSDQAYAQQVADRFCELLLNNGTTTCMTFGTIHPESVDAIFRAAQQRKMRLIAGKVMMDRNAPEYLRCPVQTCRAQTLSLIERWHGVDRLQYAITPRFAPTASKALLQSAGALLKEDSQLLMQTHLSENRGELRWVQELFPKAKHYLDVYDHYQLLTDRSLFAHAIHLCDDEWQRLASANAVIAFCPSSNLFLGSGLFDMDRALQLRIQVGLGSDVGAGTSLSMLHTMRSAYETQQLRGFSLSPLSLFYRATLGGAKALRLDHVIGNFAEGKEADFVIFEFNKPELLHYRYGACQTLEEKLFALALLGSDQSVKNSYILGVPALSEQR